MLIEQSSHFLQPAHKHHIPGADHAAANFDPRVFCADKDADGLYRNPTDCSGIIQVMAIFEKSILSCRSFSPLRLFTTFKGVVKGVYFKWTLDFNKVGCLQCFGGEPLVYPSCRPGLFFNEEQARCDYASAVPECAYQKDPTEVEGGESERLERGL